VSEQILDWELIADDGNTVGKIEDYIIEPISGEVISYLFLASDRGNILTRRFLLSPEGITNIGNKRVLATTTAVETSQPYTEGLNRLLVQAKDFIIEDRENTLQHLEAVKSRFTNLVEQFKTDAPPKIEQVRGQVSGKVQELKEQATEKAQGFKEQATEKAQELKAQAQEKAQSLAEGAQPMINQAKEKAQSLAVGAQPMINQAKVRMQGIAEGAKEKVQAIADEAKKQLDKNPELVAPGDEKVTQTIETTAERVTTNLAPAVETPAESGTIDQPSVAIETTETAETTEHQGS
jgi:gas vesicle protein